MNNFALLATLLFQSALGESQWRVLHPDGTVATGWGATSLRVEAGTTLAPRAIWAWSYRTAPRRIEPSAARNFSQPNGSEPAWLEVRVLRHTRGERARGKVLAAPAEMWRELPESQLPAWPIGKTGSIRLPVDRTQEWRLRFVAEGEGSWWVKARQGQRLVTLEAEQSHGIEISLTHEDGSPVERVWAALSEPVLRPTGARTWALAAVENGVLTVQGLPDDQELALTLFKGGYAPLAVRGWPSTFPHHLTLGRGGQITGRVIDQNRRPLLQAEAQVEAWIPGTSRLVRLAAQTDQKGQFAIGGIPDGKVTLTIQARGHVNAIETLELAEGEHRDLGDQMLAPGGELQVVVVDERQLPIPNAEVVAGPGLAGTSDAKGRLTIVGVPAAPLELKGAAVGFLPATERLDPPFPAEALLVLRHGFRFKGRLLDPQGKPVAGGTLRIEAAGCSQEGAVMEDGTFQEEWRPDRAAELSLRSPGSRELRLALAPGHPGELRDLGDLTVATGLAIKGRIVAGESSLGVPQARVWLPRPTPQGPAVAWGARDLLETSSADDGTFVLSGLEAGPAIVRIDAGAYARSSIEMLLSSPAEEGTPIDIGTIRLDEGARVRVHLDRRPLGGAAAGAPLARVDLRQNWLEADMLTSQVWNGEAEIPHVPPGSALVTVIDGRKVLCEQKVDVPEGGELGVECSQGALAVSGRVVVGGAPNGPGTLIWRAPTSQGWARIDNQTSPTGLRQQQAFAAGRPQVDVPVEVDGSFQTAELGPGAWKVNFLPQQGSATPELDITIPAGEHFETILPFAGLNLLGNVETADGAPVAGAKVTDLKSGALAISRPDGTFSLMGLPTGQMTIQARLEGLSSDPMTLVLEPSRPSDPIRLTLGQREPPQVEVAVTDQDGRPAPGAMIFLEEEGKGTRLLVAGQNGATQSGLEAPYAPRIRAAAFGKGAFALGNWEVATGARQKLALALPNATGTLLVSCRAPTAELRVTSSAGWNVAWLLKSMGADLSVNPESQLRLEGLPEGVYTLAVDSASITASVVAGRTSEAALQ